MTDPSPGDRVRLSMSDGATFEGLLMPSSRFGSPEVVVLKLDSGYNVGFVPGPNGLKIIKKKQEKLRIHNQPPFDPKKPTISVLGTGGTIASFVDYRTGGVHPATRPEEIAASVPELFKQCNVQTEILFNLLSEDMQPEHWTKIAEKVAWHLNNGAKGVVIPHGTDTLAHTAAALSFCLKGLSGPVVLVGSQRSSDRPSSDAATNLLAAARVAANTDLGEVVVVMHETMDNQRCSIHRGTRVRKMHTSRRDAFQSINVLPLGWVDAVGVTLNQPYRKATPGRVLCDAAWDEEVSIIYAYPGLWPKHIEDVVMKATVIIGTGLGHIAERCESGLQSVIERGAFVAMASQCINGRTNLNVYSRGRDLLSMGVVPVEDMLPEVAYIKLMWILGHTSKLSEVHRLFLTPMAGELGAPTDSRSFGRGGDI